MPGQTVHHRRRPRSQRRDVEGLQPFPRCAAGLCTGTGSPPTLHRGPPGVQSYTLPGRSQATQELQARGVGDQYGCRRTVQQQHNLLTIRINILLQQRQVPSEVRQRHQSPQVCQHNACRAAQPLARSTSSAPGSLQWGSPFMHPWAVQLHCRPQPANRVQHPPDNSATHAGNLLQMVHRQTVQQDGSEQHAKSPTRPHPAERSRQRLPRTWCASRSKNFAMTMLLSHTARHSTT